MSNNKKIKRQDTATTATENKYNKVIWSKFEWNDETQKAYYNGKELKQRVVNSGYVNVSLVGYEFRLHRLICLKYIPNDNTQRKHVDHINEIKSDNRITNLQWLSNSENMLKSYQMRSEPLTRQKYIYHVTPATDTSISFVFTQRKHVAEYLNRSARAVSFVLDGTTNTCADHFITRTPQA